ncbi:hypothetical protein B9Z19DRAFT_1079868 [Tuber borchii]|uniref:Uncharacterized protein n=1 Tax=Tuber borchii TaxID=42251 RepID=A0A2T6ZXS1_TUBBO|nr:hypothetical protein B9Z19DRAFT_1079868 [Tuber borchii]
MRVGCVAVLVVSKFGVGSAGWTRQGISGLRSARAREVLKKQKGFADDIVMFGSVLCCRPLLFSLLISLFFLLFSKQLNAGVGKCL